MKVKLASFPTVSFTGNTADLREVTTSCPRVSVCQINTLVGFQRENEDGEDGRGKQDRRMLEQHSQQYEDGDCSSEDKANTD